MELTLYLVWKFAIGIGIVIFLWGVIVKWLINGKGSAAVVSIFYQWLGMGLLCSLLTIYVTQYDKLVKIYHIIVGD